MFTIECTKELDPTIYGKNAGNESDNINWVSENNHNIAFNNRVNSYFNRKIKILELGCDGGVVVEQFHNDGHLSLGLDAHPVYLCDNFTFECSPDLLARRKRSWLNIPDNLFQCNIGKPFKIQYNNEDITFDFIHSWECFEHIATNDVPTLFQNILNHSHIGTIFIGSISNSSEIGHITKQDQSWWSHKFNEIGFENLDINFGTDIIRNISTSFVLYMIRKR